MDANAATARHDRPAISKKQRRAGLRRRKTIQTSPQYSLTHQYVNGPGSTKQGCVMVRYPLPKAPARRERFTRNTHGLHSPLRKGIVLRPVQPCDKLKQHDDMGDRSESGHYTHEKPPEGSAQLHHLTHQGNDGQPQSKQAATVYRPGRRRHDPSAERRAWVRR